MPLGSRITKTTDAPPETTKAPAPAADQSNISPRRRGGLSTTAAAAQPAPEPRKDIFEEEEETGAETEAVAEDPPADPPEVVTPAPAKAPGRPAGAKDKAPRAPRAPVALPEGAAESDDPVVLRRVLTAIDNEARELRKAKEARLAEVEAEFKPEQDRLRAEYKAVSNKLANTF